MRSARRGSASAVNEGSQSAASASSASPLTLSIKRDGADTGPTSASSR